MNIEYETIDINNETHRMCLMKIWKDKKVKCFFDAVFNKKTFEDFLLSFNTEDVLASERLVKINNNYVAWTRAYRNENNLMLTCIVLQEHREQGYGKAILGDLINRNKEMDILVEIRKDNWLSLKTLKSFDFTLEKKSVDGLLTYKKSHIK